MSTNLDHIDLNSDALPVEQEPDVNGFDGSETSANVGGSAIGTRAELGYEKKGDAHVANDEDGRCEAVADVLGDGGLGGKTYSPVRGFDMEAETGTIDEESDAKVRVVNGEVEPGIDGEVAAGLVGEIKPLVRGFDMEAEIASVDKEVAELPDAAADREPGVGGEEEEGRIVNSCKLEEGVLTGGACAAVYSCSVGDSIKLRNVNVLEYSPENVGMELHVTNTSQYVASDGLQNQEMEIDEPASAVDNQIMSLNPPEPKVSQYDEYNFNPFNLVVDLNSYKNADGNGHDESHTQFDASKVEFRVSDLVWGKVRSHPWWPGQIFDPSAASKKANKYIKNDSFLIAYFGDHTFAWNDISKIKPFRSHFPQMEKQSSMESFRYAVDCALDEVARRMEFGLACPCLPEESHSKLKTQIVVNSGIRKESRRRNGGDSLTSVDSFVPVKLLGFIRAMALSPFAEFDRLQFVIARAQVLAFYRLKGYCQLPEFNMLGRLWETDIETSLSGEVNFDEVAETAAPKFKEDVQLSGMEEINGPRGVSSKRKLTSENSSMRNAKKRKNLSDLMARRQMNMSYDECGLGINSGKKVSYSKSGSKRKSVHSISHDLEVKRGRSPLWKWNDSKSPQHRETFRVGKSILRVASQMNGSTTVENGDVMSRKTAMGKEGIEKVLCGKSYSDRLMLIKDGSSEEMLSQLCLTAQDPVNRYIFLTSGASFFLEFRNSVSLEYIKLAKVKQSELDVHGGDTEKDLKKSGTCETSEFEGIVDSYWPDRIVQSMPEEILSPENQTEANDFLPKTPSEKCSSAIELRATVQSSPNLESTQRNGDETHDLESSEPLGNTGDSCGEDLSPTALILNFTDIDSVPSAANLNKIFSHYGALREPETKVLKKSSSAKVVFKRRVDAETAFSSAGKYSIFGPSLVSYRLKYMQSTESRTSPRIRRQSRKG